MEEMEHDVDIYFPKPRVHLPSDTLLDYNMYINHVIRGGKLCSGTPCESDNGVSEHAGPGM